MKSQDRLHLAVLLSANQLRTPLLLLLLQLPQQRRASAGPVAWPSCWALLGCTEAPGIARGMHCFCTVLHGKCTDLHGDSTVLHAECTVLHGLCTVIARFCRAFARRLHGSARFYFIRGRQVSRRSRGNAGSHDRKE